MSFMTSNQKQNINLVVSGKIEQKPKHGISCKKFNTKHAMILCRHYKKALTKWDSFTFVEGGCNVYTK